LLTVINFSLLCRKTLGNVASANMIQPTNEKQHLAKLHLSLSKTRMSVDFEESISSEFTRALKTKF